MGEPAAQTGAALSVPSMTPDPPATAALVARAREGDREAAERLFQDAAERVLLYIRLRLGADLAARVDALDVLQETYAAALGGLAEFEARGPGSFGAWLCRVAEHRLLDLAAYHGAAKRRPPGEVLPVSVVLERARSAQTGPLSAADRRERGERLTSALAQLEPAAREAVLLRHFQGCTTREIAARVGRSETAVRRLLGSALGALGSALAGGGDA